MRARRNSTLCESWWKHFSEMGLYSINNSLLAPVCLSTTLDALAGDPFHKRSMSSWLKYYVCCNFYTDDSITVRFGTCHDSSAVMVCAKLGYDEMINFHERAKCILEDCDDRITKCLRNDSWPRQPVILVWVKRREKLVPKINEKSIYKERWRW